MNKVDSVDAFYELVTPYTRERFAEVKSKGLKMAHYTTAENAALILQNKTVWLRNAALMNDFSEIAYGNYQLKLALSSGLEARLETAVAQVYPGLVQEVKQWLENADQVTREQTYLMSLAAHHPDDLLGKLSMWRAYGGATSGVAIVFNTDAFEHDSDQLGAYSSPVLYGDWNQLREKLEVVVGNIEQNLDLLRQVPLEAAKSILFNALQFWVLSTKHPAFSEEEEWRVIHMPVTEPSEYICTPIKTIRGVPQMICELKLEDQPNLNMPWLNLDRLIHKVIIGPCAYPVQVAWSFIEILREKNVTNPHKRVATAFIPLRQQW